MTLNNKDILAGATFALCGVFFLGQALLSLEVGSALEMGPGYFPVIIGGLLIVLGLAIAIKGAMAGAVPIGALNWRGIVLIGLAPVLFGILVRPFGLVPATAVAVLVASFASARMSVWFALALTVGLTALCVLIFSVWLGLNLPLVRFGG